jgi:hypothetical protein
MDHRRTNFGHDGSMKALDEAFKRGGSIKAKRIMLRLFVQSLPSAAGRENGWTLSFQNVAGGAVALKANVDKMVERL